jgi:hypothetical protein
VVCLFTSVVDNFPDVLTINRLPGVILEFYDCYTH